MRSIATHCFLSTLILTTLSFSPARCQTTAEELLERVGLKPTATERGQMDTVGFAMNDRQMDAVLEQCKRLASPRLAQLKKELGFGEETVLKAAVCPHDDYYYAGRLYSLIMPFIRAKRVLIFGVFHKARVFDFRDSLVFDSYQTWHGPYGSVRVSPIREELLDLLPAEDYVVNNDMQMVEHSVEAIVPFLQAYHRDVEIVSILVPYMAWERMDKLASDLAEALSRICMEEGWKLGRDIALISSCDAVHYGDAGWGGKNYAPFGTDLEGYGKAVGRDLDLLEEFLSGPLEKRNLEAFLYRCVDRADVERYLVTWCGRFSVPFGLDVAVRLEEKLENAGLTGTLLDYGTSISEVSLDVEGLGGIGPTAPNNFHHFVGYAAVGYR